MITSRLILFSGLFFLLLQGCSPQSTGQNYLLGTSKIKGNKVIKADELEALIPQKPNRRFLGLPVFPYLALYRLFNFNYSKEKEQRKLQEITEEYQQKTTEYAGNDSRLKRIERKYAKKMAKAKRRVEEGNGFMRIGEPPVYFDAASVAKNVEKMKGYLFNKGFFKNEVSYSTDTSFRRIRITYSVRENTPTIVRSIHYRVLDEAIDSLLRRNHKFSFLHNSKRYDGQDFEQERIRIESLMLNNGYYGFSRQYVSFLVNDTIRSTGKDSLVQLVDLTVRIDNPTRSTRHKAYTIGEVNFEVVDPLAGLIPDLRKDTIHLRGINYLQSRRKYSPKILDSKIRIRPGSLYSRQHERDTQRQLTLTDQFRFINYGFDSTHTTLKAYFKAIPLDKYQISADIGLNVIQQQAPGPFANLSYKIRNVFNGLENFEINLRGGTEAVSGFNAANKLYRSEEFSLNTSLIFQQLLFPVGAIRYRLGTFNPKTQLGAGFNYINRPEYTRTGIKSALTYTLQPSLRSLYSFSLIDLNILNTTYMDSDFSKLLDTLQSQGNNLKNSFRKSFVSDINFTFVYNTNPMLSTPVNAQYLRLAAESGGTTLGIFPGQKKWINEVFAPKGNDDTLQFFQYIRWNLDYRRYWPLNSKTSFVARINSGGVHGYGVSSVPPYEKYFFAGGSNSVRAWLPRRLGPGASAPRITSSNLSIEAPGEFLLEGNLELRGHLFRFFGDINYAVFLDAGNVWNFKKNGKSSEGNLEWKTLGKQIAVGSGVGLRYDFQYFVIRFDFGFKVYDPYRQEFMLNKLHLGQLFNTRRDNFLNLNLGVGYPF